MEKKRKKIKEKKEIKNKEVTTNVGKKNIKRKNTNFRLIPLFKQYKVHPLAYEFIMVFGHKYNMHKIEERKQFFRDLIKWAREEKKRMVLKKK